MFSAFVTFSWRQNKRQIDFPTEQMVGLHPGTFSTGENEIISKEVNPGPWLLCSLILPCTLPLQLLEQQKNNSAIQYG